MKECFPKYGELHGFWKNVDAVIPRRSHFINSTVLPIFDGLGFCGVSYAMMAATNGDIGNSVFGIIGTAACTFGGYIYRCDIHNPDQH